MNEEVFPIYVSKKKRVLHYVFAAMRALNENPKVMIRARSPLIDKAATIALDILQMYPPGTVEILDIRLGTEDLPRSRTDPDAGTVKVPYIEIIIGRKENS